MHLICAEESGEEESRAAAARLSPVAPTDSRPLSDCPASWKARHMSGDRDDKARSRECWHAPMAGVASPNTHPLPTDAGAPSPVHVVQDQHPDLTSGGARAHAEAVSSSPVHVEMSEHLDVSSSGGSTRGAEAKKVGGKKRGPKVPASLRCLVGEAVRDFNMIRQGDRVLVAVSGGKDSLTMLHVLLELQRRSPVHFEVAAATVDPQTAEYDPWPLVPYMQALGVRYHMLSKPIIEMAKTCMDAKRPSLCAFCSRMKRGMLYSCMREHGYTCLAMGQHLDDGASDNLPPPPPPPHSATPDTPLLASVPRASPLSL